MAGKGMSGQLNLFDLFADDRNLDGDVQMVSLVPEEAEAEPDPVPEETVTEEVQEPEEPEPVPEEIATEEAQEPEELEKPEPISEETATEEPEAELESVPTDQPVMHKIFTDQSGSVVAEISYLNYNKVYVRRPEQEGKTVTFENAKDAVDFYIEEMLKLGEAYEADN